MNPKFKSPAHAFLRWVGDEKKVFHWIGQTTSGIRIDRKCDGERIECEVDFSFLIYADDILRRLLGSILSSSHEIAFASNFSECDPSLGVCRPTDAMIFGDFYVERSFCDVFSPAFSEPRIKIKVPSRTKMRPLFFAPRDSDIFLRFPSY